MPDPALVQLVKNGVEEKLREGEEPDPVLFLVIPAEDLPKPKCAVVPLGHVPKERWRPAVRQLVADEGATEVAFVSSAWTLRETPQEEVDAWYEEHGTIRDHPDAREEVSVVYQAEGEDAKLWVAEYSTDDRGEVTAWKAWETWELSADG